MLTNSYKKLEIYFFIWCFEWCRWTSFRRKKYNFINLYSF